jgi:hypothetical protein
MSAFRRYNDPYYHFCSLAITDADESSNGGGEYAVSERQMIIDGKSSASARKY